jgi:hypothetical protein
MPRISIGFGIALVILGVVGYMSTGGVSITALIPSAFGFLLVCAGIVSYKESLRMHALHLAVVVGVLGVLGSANGFIGFFILLFGGEVERPQAVVSQAIMAVLMTVFVVLCVKSFIATRRARRARVSDES